MGLTSHQNKCGFVGHRTHEITRADVLLIIEDIRHWQTLAHLQDTNRLLFNDGPFSYARIAMLNGSLSILKQIVLVFL